ncbi:hypothetical protein TNCV_1137411 [Trichonephila clavipes]|nr:hypothetical protein TNCV_1137411 [Trichonephila clavipes]
MADKEFVGNMKLFIQISIQLVVQVGGKGLMIRGVFDCNGMSPLITKKGKRTGNEYSSHLENVLKPLLVDWLPDDDGIYKHDNAIPYHAKLV